MPPQPGGLIHERWRIRLDRRASLTSVVEAVHRRWRPGTPGLRAHLARGPGAEHAGAPPTRASRATLRRGAARLDAWWSPPEGSTPRCCSTPGLGRRRGAAGGSGHPSLRRGAGCRAARPSYQEAGAEEALRVIREFRTLLADELGLDSPRCSTTWRPRCCATTRGSTGGSLAAAWPRRPTDRARAELAGDIGGLLGDGASVAVVGPAGIGKTTSSRRLRTLPTRPGFRGRQHAVLTGPEHPPASPAFPPTSLPGDGCAPPPWASWRRGRPEELPLVADDLCRAYLRPGLVVLVDDAEDPDPPSLDVLSGWWVTGSGSSSPAGRASRGPSTAGPR